MTDPQQAPVFDSQAPGRADYQRAAALMLHQYRVDMEGWNLVMAEADQLERISALVLAIVEMAGNPPAPPNTPEGMAGLQAVAQGMALDDPPE